MQAFEANFVNVLVRFYLMMAVVIVAGFTGFWPLALLALPVFLTAILGFGKEKTQTKPTPVKNITVRKTRLAA